MKSNWVALLFAALLLAFGIFVIHGPQLEGGFAYLHGDLGDARFVHLVLEHGYRVAAGLSRDELWSPSWTMYPLRNTLSFSEVLIGNLPIYGLARALGASEAASSQIWSVACSVLNFLAAALLLRRLRFEPLAVGLGAFLFAFALPRSLAQVHTQLFPQFPTLLAAYAVLRYFQVDGPSRSARFGWLLAAGGALAWQVACSVYLGWFAALGTVVATLAALATPTLRRELLPRLRADAVLLASAFVLTILAVLPIALHYLEARSLAGGRSWASLELPTIATYLNPLPRARLYHWLDHEALNVVFGKQRGWIFPGVAAYAALGLFWHRRRAWRPELSTAQANTAMLALISAVILILLPLDLGRGVTLWGLVFHGFPGADAIRATYRIGLLLLLPYAVLVATVFHVALVRWRAGRSRLHRPQWATLGLAVAVLFSVMEQRAWNPARHAIARGDQRVGLLVEAIRSREPRCALFAFRDVEREGTAATHVDAMWASLETGVPTVNGGIGTDYEPWAHLWHMDQLNPAGVLKWLAAMNTALPLGDGQLCIFERRSKVKIVDVSR